MQLIFQLHPQEKSSALVGEEDLSRVLSEFWLGVHERVDAEVKDFSETLVRGVLQNKAEIDQLIDKHAANWKLSRMARVDLSILRLAAYELCYSSQVPLQVAINEAIELAKRFGTKESSGFVNGILDSLGKEKGR